jgi:peptidoglycan/LPS O-acetylase OafA/YrhL
VLGGIDLTKLLALGGNGVDLFFVISGFCMYYFYASNSSFSYSDFWGFIKKRWIRLSPAFYFSTLVYILFRWKNETIISFSLKFLTSVFYLNSFSRYNVEGFFWSLGVEWQFYLIIPFMLSFQNKFGFLKSFVTVGITLLFGALITVWVLKNKSDILTDQILFRYFEFAAGIVVARLLLLKKAYCVRRAFWLVLFILVAYLGRILLSNQIQLLSSNYYNAIKLLGFTVMSAGFAGIVYLALTSSNILKHVFGSPICSFIGKISYSFYLWHGLVHTIIGELIKAEYGSQGILWPILTFLISSFILLPVSYLSFHLLERPFMSKHKASFK